MAGRRRRGRGHRVPWGPDESRPDFPDSPDDPIDEVSDDEPGDHPPKAGGAGVREPRRPKPTLPAMPVSRQDPPPDTFLDVHTEEIADRA